MVETSVAVATPSTTAARITNGSTSAGSAIRKVRAISRLPARGGPRPDPRCGSASARRSRAGTPSTTPGSSPPVNSAAIDTPVTEPMVMSTRLGGMVSVCAPVADKQRDQIAGLGAARLHFRKQHRRDRGHVGGLRARNAGHQIHRADQHVMQPAAHVTRAGSPGTRPWRAPCRSSRSAGRGRRTAAPPAE